MTDQQPGGDTPTTEDTIALADCQPRHLYRLHSRNLRYGAFNPDTRGFIGIRTKFSNRYLFTEYHYDTGAPFGTARPIEDLGEIADERIRLWERYPGTFCTYCGRDVHYDESLRGAHTPGSDDPATWPWKHDEDVDDCPGRVNASARSTYTPLFRILEDLDEDHDPDDDSRARQRLRAAGLTPVDVADSPVAGADTVELWDGQTWSVAVSDRGCDLYRDSTYVLTVDALDTAVTIITDPGGPAPAT